MNEIQSNMVNKLGQYIPIQTRIFFWLLDNNFITLSIKYFIE